MARPRRPTVGATRDFDVEDDNRLSSDGTYDYFYDNEGNLVQRSASDGSHTDYGWDYRNRLVSVTEFDPFDNEQLRVEYRDDANNKLIGRKLFVGGSSTPSESQAFVYWDGQIVLEFDGAGSGDLETDDLAHRYLWNPAAVDQLFADEWVDDVSDARGGDRGHPRFLTPIVRR